MTRQITVQAFNDSQGATHTISVPPGWKVAQIAQDGVAFRIPGGRFVMSSVERRADDGHLWMHLSQSHPSRLPPRPELVEMRDALLGSDVECYQVCPPASRYVNLNERVLHLWACLDKPEGVLPRFEGEVEGVGRSI
jgi:hypothetical protein